MNNTTTTHDDTITLAQLAGETTEAERETLGCEPMTLEDFAKAEAAEQQACADGAWGEGIPHVASDYDNIPF